MLNLDEELKTVTDQYSLLNEADPDNGLLKLAVLDEDGGIGFIPEFYDRYLSDRDWVNALISYAVDLGNAIPNSEDSATEIRSMVSTKYLKLRDQNPGHHLLDEGNIGERGFHFTKKTHQPTFISYCRYYCELDEALSR
jgi:hypothetical protein|tara:strand:- start:214 stop:630 length:417 start_codon:yes stop_codon:yes gene_type:complete